MDHVQNIHNYLAKATHQPSVRIKIKIWNTYIVGKIIEFDNHLNLLLSDAREIYLGPGGHREKELGNIMIRGASIILIGQKYETINLSEEKISQLMVDGDEDISDNGGAEY